MNLDNLTGSEKFIFKWQYGMLGDFEKALIGAIKIADDDNRNKLNFVFPDEVNGYIHYIRTPGWWKEVQLKAGLGVEPD